MWHNSQEDDFSLATNLFNRQISNEHSFGISKGSPNGLNICLPQHQFHQKKTLMESSLALFVHGDDFCKAFLPFWNRQLLSCGARQRQQERSLNLCEIMTILIAFHQSQYRDIKAYYCEQVLKHLRLEFPGLVSYNRFVEFIPSALVHCVLTSRSSAWVTAAVFPSLIRLPWKSVSPSGLLLTRSLLA